LFDLDGLVKKRPSGLVYVGIDGSRPRLMTAAIRVLLRELERRHSQSSLDHGRKCSSSFMSAKVLECCLGVGHLDCDIVELAEHRPIVCLESAWDAGMKFIKSGRGSDVAFVVVRDGG